MRYRKMNPKKKSVWVTALRSGKYRQVSDALHAGRGFCCIGVYGDIQGIPRTLMKEHAETLGEPTREEPKMFQEVLGDIGTIGTREKLAEMNDEGKSFKEIADWIEANL